MEEKGGLDRRLATRRKAFAARGGKGVLLALTLVFAMRL
jgi:hypothetical protein